MRTNLSHRAILVLFWVIIIFTSCNTLEEKINDAIPNIVERTDITISGNLNYEDFNQSVESDLTSDLVTYNYYGDSSENFDFIIHLANGYQLLIEMVDGERMNPWEQVGQPYNIYPPTVLEDKLTFVHAYLFSSIGELLYSDSPDSFTPKGTTLDVFKITSSNHNSIRCRMRNMTMYYGAGSKNSITINGTFVGALIF